MYVETSTRAVPAELTPPPRMEAMLPAVVAGAPTALAVFVAKGLKDEATSSSGGELGSNLPVGLDLHGHPTGE